MRQRWLSWSVAGLGGIWRAFRRSGRRTSDTLTGLSTVPRRVATLSGIGLKPVSPGVRPLSRVSEVNSSLCDALNVRDPVRSVPPCETRSVSDVEHEALPIIIASVFLRLLQIRGDGPVDQRRVKRSQRPQRVA